MLLKNIMSNEIMLFVTNVILRYIFIMNIIYLQM